MEADALALLRKLLWVDSLDAIQAGGKDAPLVIRLCAQGQIVIGNDLRCVQEQQQQPLPGAQAEVVFACVQASLHEPVAQGVVPEVRQALVPEVRQATG